MTNFEKIMNEIWKDAPADTKDFAVKHGLKLSGDESDNLLNFLLWLCFEYKEPILDDVEKKYLSAVIKPFRNDIESIVKLRFGEYEIVFTLKNGEFFHLPKFPLNSNMYKGMEEDRHYTLEELGL